MSATTNPSASAVMATVTATVTMSAEQRLFMRDFYGLLSCLDILVFLLGTWTVLVIGVSRFSVFPVFLPFCAAIGNGLCFHTLSPSLNTDLGPTVILIAYVFWTVQNLGAPFYNYFMLRTLLAGRRRERMIFTVTFNILMFCTLVIRFPQTYYMVNNNNPRVTYIHFCLMKSYFSLLDATEVLSAAFLLQTLHRALKISRRQNGNGQQSTKRESLLQQLAQSSEVRLATLAGVGITRAVAWGWTLQHPSKQMVAFGAGDFAVLTENVYPMLLIMDLFVARLKGGTLDRNAEILRRKDNFRLRAYLRHGAWTAPTELKSGRPRSFPLTRMENVVEEGYATRNADTTAENANREQNVGAVMTPRSFGNFVRIKHTGRSYNASPDRDLEGHSIVTVNVASVHSRATSSNASHIGSPSNLSTTTADLDMQRRNASHVTV